MDDACLAEELCPQVVVVAPLLHPQGVKPDPVGGSANGRKSDQIYQISYPDINNVWFCT